MTERSRNGSEDAEVQEPDRSEFEWLMARDEDPNAPAPSAQVAQSYGHLEDLLATMPDDTDESWHAAVMQRIRDTAPVQAVPRRTKRWAGLAIGLVAAALILVVVLPRTSGVQTFPTDLAIYVGNGPTVRGGGVTKVHLGTRFGSERLSAKTTELRMYAPDGALVARCPGVLACVSEGDAHHVEIEATKRGTYLLIANEPPRAPLHDEQRNEYVAALERERIPAIMREIEVQ